MSTDDLQNTIDWLLTPAAIRERCGKIFALAEADELEHFALDLSRLDTTADFVLEVTRHAYPDLEIPYHSRWRHFSAGGVDRWKQLTEQHTKLSGAELARAGIDLVVVSVLLDAGAGDDWSWFEKETDQIYKRSEGLAVASFRAFAAGAFSADPLDAPLRADTEVLKHYSENRLAEIFQITSDNPLAGLQGRTALLQRLGQTVQTQRVGDLLDSLTARADDGQLPAAAILEEVLRAFNSIWPGATLLGERSLGDVWPHSAIGGDGLVPFHKLSQWLSYSLVESLEQSGLQITALDALTGLPEYRNGGLFIDMGVLRPKRDELLTVAQDAGSEAIVEWRALTVILLDQLADRIRTQLGMTPAQLPLARVLEGGSWSAGRRIAKRLRPDTGGPPVRLESTGTVF